MGVPHTQSVAPLDDDRKHCWLRLLMCLSLPLCSGVYVPVDADEPFRARALAVESFFFEVCSPARHISLFIAVCIHVLNDFFIFDGLNNLSTTSDRP